MENRHQCAQKQERFLKKIKVGMGFLGEMLFYQRLFFVS